MAALGITLGISITGGALSGFVCSRFGNLEELFDDKQHFLHAEYDSVVEVELGANPVTQTDREN